MFSLADCQVEYIEHDLMKLGVVTKSIRDNLLDHICILLEERMTHEHDFEAEYKKVLDAFYRSHIREVEVNARLAVLAKRHLILSKWQFFLISLTLVICPFLIYLLSSPEIFKRDVWGPVVAYSAWPVSSLLVLFCIPNHLDPPIRAKSKIAVGFPTGITVVHT